MIISETERDNQENKVNKVNRIKSEALFPVIIELIKNNQRARLTVTGNSMSPFLKEGRDTVEFSAVDFSQIHRGDIVLIKRKCGYYVMHRVYKKAKDSFYMVGDAQQWIEGPLYPEQLIAIVTKVWRKGREIDCNNVIWKLLSHIWLILRRFRYLIFGVYARVKRIRNKFFRRAYLQ